MDFSQVLLNRDIKIIRKCIVKKFWHKNVKVVECGYPIALIPNLDVLIVLRRYTIVLKRSSHDVLIVILGIHVVTIF